MSKQREAFELRDRGVAIKTIALLIDVPKSTVGDWLNGYGETVYEIRCEACGSDFVAFNALRRYCTNSCRRRFWKRGDRERKRRAYHERRAAA